MKFEYTVTVTIRIQYGSMRRSVYVTTDLGTSVAGMIAVEAMQKQYPTAKNVMYGPVFVSAKDDERFRIWRECHRIEEELHEVRV